MVDGRLTKVCVLRKVDSTQWPRLGLSLSITVSFYSALHGGLRKCRLESLPMAATCTPRSL